MIKCCNEYSQYNYIKPKKLIKLEEEYINSAIRQMILEYNKENQLLDFLKPITKKRKNKNSKIKYSYNIQNKEYQSVDIDQLMRNMPIGFLNCFRELNIDVPEFLSRKLIKILKMVISKEIFELDIVEKTLLFYMIDNNKDKFTNEFVFDDKDELIKLEVDTYINDLLNEFCDDGINVSIEDDKQLANDIYKEAFFNLYSLLQLEKAGEVSIMYDNFDEDKLIYSSIVETFNVNGGGKFRFNSLLELMTDINMSIPFEFLNACCESKYTKSTFIFIQQVEDLSNELEYLLRPVFEKTNRIIDMPTQSKKDK